MAASLSCNAFKSSLQTLRGTNSSRTSSPSRPSSPRLGSPAKTPRSLSPQRAGAQQTSANTFNAEELFASLSQRTPSFSSNPSRFSDASAFERPRSDSGATLLGTRQSSSSFSLPNTSRSRPQASPTTSGAPGSPADPPTTPQKPSRTSTLTSRSSHASILSPPPSHAISPTAPAPAAPAADSPDSSPGAKHRQMVKLLARVGGDASRAALLVQSPLDGVASEVAYTASELLLKTLASPRQASPGSPSSSPPAAPGTPPAVNPVHVNVMSVVVSTLLSGAAHAAVELPALAALDASATGPQVEAVHAAGELTPVQRLAMRLSSVSIAAALAKAPPLRAADAEDAFNVGFVSATAGVKMLLHPSTMSGGVPDIGGMLEGVLSTLHDSMEDLDLSSPAVLMTQPIAGPWGGHLLLPTPKP